MSLSHSLSTRFFKFAVAGSEKVLCTSAGTLPCSRIIFVALMDPSLVKQRTIDALKEAEKEGMGSIAIPALGTGKKTRRVLNYHDGVQLRTGYSTGHGILILWVQYPCPTHYVETPIKTSLR